MVRRLSRARRLRNLVAVLTTVVLTWGGSVVLATSATAAPVDVVFADPDLEAAVLAELGGGATAPVTQTQAATITSLDASSSTISDLGGIQHLTNLMDLNLYGNGISDVSDLAGLTNLAYLNLNYSSVSDVSPLAGLTDLTHLYLFDNSVSDVADLAGLTNLTDLILNGNDVSDVSDLSGLANLANLFLGRNNVSDVSPLAGLTNLKQLDLHDNNISEVSDLAGLTNLTLLTLENNSISDVSDLSALTNLTLLRLRDQSVVMPDAVVGASTGNPVVDLVGSAVSVTSANAAFTYASPPANSWTFTTTGAKTATWSTSVNIGDVVRTEFSGTITQDITEVPLPGDVYPEDPEIIPATCDNGEVVGPQVNLPTTDGLDYAVVGDVAPGSTITVTATRADERILRVQPDTGWVGDNDHMSATLRITLDAVDCEAAPAADDSNDDSQASTELAGVLPTTGIDSGTTLLGALGALTILTGVALMTARRRSATY